MRREFERSPGPVLTVVCGVLAALALTVRAPAQEAPPEERMLERSWAVEPGGSLRVRVGDADVAVGPATSGRAEVEVWLRSNDLDWARGEFARLTFEATREGREVRVSSSPEPRSGDRGGWPERRWMSVRVEVRVPSSFAVDLRTGDGDVELGTITGTVLIDTGDGDVDVGDLEGPGITIHTSDGDIRAVALRAPRVEVETQDGNIQIGEVDGLLAARTSDGDIRVGTTRSTEVTLHTGDGDVDLVLAGAARLAVETGDGDVLLQLPADLQADLDVEGEEVDIQGASLQLDGRVRRRSARGSLNGGGPPLRVRSRDGTVRLVLRR